MKSVVNQERETREVKSSVVGMNSNSERKSSTQMLSEAFQALEMFKKNASSVRNKIT
jgi:hypothetical protein